MKSILGKLVFAALLIIGAYILRQFENIWALFVVALMLGATFLIQKSGFDDTRLVAYVESAHGLRLLFFGSALTLFLGFLSGLMLWGTYIHLADFTWEGSTYIQSGSGAKSLPEGNYPNWLLTLLISTLAMFFCTLSFRVLAGGLKGLRKRFGKSHGG